MRPISTVREGDTRITFGNKYYVIYMGEFLNLPNPSDRTRPWGLLSL
jgi:hypothetical protein